MLQLRIDFCAAENSMCDHKIEIYLHQMAILSTVISLFNFCKAFTCKVCFYLYQRPTKAMWSKYQNHKSELLSHLNDVLVHVDLAYLQFTTFKFQNRSFNEQHSIIYRG